MAYFWLKTLHLVGVVSWFAGLFHLGRIFVYHTEALARAEPARGVLAAQFAHMERLAYRVICTPALVVTVGAALGMLAVRPALLHDGWLHAKLALVALLVVYHLHCGRLLGRFALGAAVPGSTALRAQNEIPTVLLMGIVLLAVFKALATPVIVAQGLGGLGALVVVGFAAARRRRAAARVAVPQGALGHAAR